MKKTPVKIAAAGVAALSLSAGAIGAVNAGGVHNSSAQAKNTQVVTADAAKHGVDKTHGATMNWKSHKVVAVKNTKANPADKAKNDALAKKLAAVAQEALQPGKTPTTVKAASTTTDFAAAVQAASATYMLNDASTTVKTATTNATGTTTFTPQAGVDVSGYSGNVNWNSFKTQGMKFAISKVSEGNYYTNPYFASQKAGAKAQGMVVGSYHFANPKSSSGAAQADFAIAKGGSWTPGDLPLTLDMEYDPYSSNMCYGMTQAQLNSWVTSFQEEYKLKTGTYPIIYTTTPWWNQCMGSGSAAALVAAKSPLWNAYYQATPGNLPYTWNHLDIWQTNAVTTGSYDTDLFNGGPLLLQAYTQVRK